MAQAHTVRKKGLVMYYIQEKGQEWNAALINGFKPDYLAYSKHGKIFPGYLHLIGGMQFGNFEIYKQLLAHKEDYIQGDRGYIQGLKGINGYLRLTMNAYQKWWMDENTKTDRLVSLAKAGLRLSKWRQPTKDGHILVVPPSSPPIAELFATSDWALAVFMELSRLTKRKVMISIKGDQRPLSARLTNCHAVVTCMSNVAVDAIIAGVPVFCHPLCAAFPMALPLSRLNEIETPVTPSRIKWLCSLSYGQFTLSEIRNGFARKVILGEDYES